MERYLPYGIILCYLPPNTDWCAPRSVLDSRAPAEGWMAELTLLLVISLDGLPVRRQVTHLSTNRLIATRLGVEPAATFFRP